MTPEEREDLHLLYQACISDLSFFKSQQWSITNYALLAYAGIVGVSQIAGKTAPCWLSTILFIILIGMAFTGIILLTTLQSAIKVRQARLKFIREKLTPVFNQAWGIMEKGSEFVVVVKVLYPVLIIGGALACWIVAR